MRVGRTTSFALAIGLGGCQFAVRGLPFPDGAVADLSSVITDGAPPDLSAPDGGGPDLARLGPVLQGSIATIATGFTIDLTGEGTSDWSHWGLTNNNSFDRKNLALALLGNFTQLKTGAPPTQLAGYPTSFQWSDGTPTASVASTNTGVYTSGQGQGFRLDVVADTTTRVLTIYCGGQQSTANVNAHLSDSSAPDYNDSASDAAAMYSRTITLTYRAASAGQTLRVEWSIASAGGFVHLQSATLH